MDYTINSILKSEIKICQPKVGFRFSIDSVILARFVNYFKAEKILEIGAGSGVISVLLQKLYSYEKIDAVELQEEMFNCLKKTIEINGLNNNIKSFHCDIKEYIPENNYDLIVCNPPYRNKSTGRTCNNKNENIARFNDEMSLEDLFKFSRSYLKNLGYLYFSYDADLMTEAIYLSKKYNLEPKRLLMLFPDKNKSARLIFVECRKNAKVELKIEPPLIQNIDGMENEEFTKLFYI